MKSFSSLQKSISVFTETYKYLQLAQNPENDLQNLKSQWARDTLKKLNIHFEISGEVAEQPSILLVGNHISYLDIPLLMAAHPEISFVAKKELKSWPVFGTAARKLQTVFVERENGDSRRKARQAIHQALDEGKKVTIFPSGTTSVSEAKLWRKGAFEIAHERNCWIQPFRISYFPLRSAAYIEDDVFPFHLYQLAGLSTVKARIEFHKPVKVSNPMEDCLKWQYWSRGLLENDRDLILSS